MSINIDELTEAELRDLNHRIAERLKVYRDLRAHVTMMNFRIGERVSFDCGDHRGLITGKLIKYNRKSVTVIADTGTHWTVAPAFLRKASEDEAATSPITQLSLIECGR